MNCRFLTCIPVYNNPKTILQVIKDCLSEIPYPLLILDDGSDQPIEQLFKQMHPEENQRVFFVRHQKNQGKGVALQSAFQWALKNNFTHLVTIDGDGQHLATDLPSLIQESLSDPWALVVGDRNMQTAHVPGSSAFGKKFSNFWVRYQTSVGVADSQSGLRVYPLFFLQNMRFFCTKYDFEIEVLIRLIWKNVRVRNVKVSVIYFPPDKRVSHFHKWKDNFRITVLNTFLTIASLLREQTSPLKSSLALGLGVFVGTLPLYGLHTGIVAALAFLLRLNFVYLWVGTNISIPPLIPFLLLGSQWLGEKILHLPNDTLPNLGATIAIGSLVLGILLGTLSFLCLYLFKSLLHRKKVKKAWTGENKNKIGISIVRFILKSLGLRTAYFCLYFIVLYYFLFSFRTRQSFGQFWKIIRPQMGWVQRQLRIYRQILNFAKTLVDRGLQKESDKMFFEFIHDQSSEQLIAHFKPRALGAVVVASHVGGWELAMTCYSQFQQSKKILAVMHGIAGQETHRSRGNGQEKSEVLFSNLNQNSILKIKNYLTTGQIVGMMGDRPTTNSFELLPFFGKLAAFDSTPMRAALACQVEIYFVFSAKVDLKRYHVFTFRGNPSPEKSRTEQTQEVLIQYVKELESFITRYPEQWFNFFPFWSEKPAGR